MALQKVVCELKIFGTDGSGTLNSVLHYEVNYDDAEQTPEGAADYFSFIVTPLVAAFPVSLIPVDVSVLGTVVTIPLDPDTPVIERSISGVSGTDASERLSPANSMNIVKQTGFRGPASRGSFKTWPTSIQWQGNDGRPTTLFSDAWLAWLDTLNIVELPAVAKEAIMCVFSKKYEVYKLLSGFKPILTKWGHTGKRQYNVGS